VITKVLFLCTGNICRSPAAEALLRHRLTEAGVDAEVRSAGLLEAGHPASQYGVAVLAERGIDASAHRSRTMLVDELLGADLILGMAREHVRAAAVQAPEAWRRTFTLKELVRRGDEIGARRPGQTLDDWLAEVRADRSTADLMGDSHADDIADPIGQPRPAYESMIVELDGLIGRLFWLVWGNADLGSIPEVTWRA
jgi:protein-tyrosine phosphatase